MKKCVIFCASEFDTLQEPPARDHLVIAADGGLKHTQKLGIRPDVILGDFDSLGYVPQGAHVFPVEKDDTDAMLAIRHGLSLGHTEFLLYGCMGGTRPDHTLANYQALCYLARHGARGYLVGKDHLVTAIRNRAVTFPEDAEGIVSVFCMGPDARGVTLTNLKYPLENGTLSGSFPLGASNHFTGKSARIAVAEGCLLLIWDRKNGFPANL